MTNVILYGVPGWGSTIAEAMLGMAGIEYDFVDVEGFDRPGPARDRLMKVNPLAQVPALVLQDGTVMTETAAIALHLADVVPDAGLAPAPGDPVRPRFLRWLVWMVANVYPTFTYGDYPERWSSDAKGLDDATQAYRRKLWLQFEAEVGAPHVLGDRIGALDVYVAAMIHWRPRREWFEANCPKVTAAADAALEHPAIAAAMRRNFPQ